MVGVFVNHIFLPYTDREKGTTSGEPAPIAVLPYLKAEAGLKKAENQAGTPTGGVVMMTKPSDRNEGGVVMMTKPSDRNEGGIVMMTKPSDRSEGGIVMMTKPSDRNEDDIVTITTLFGMNRWNKQHRYKPALKINDGYIG